MDKHQFTKDEGYCKYCIEKDKRIQELEAERLAFAVQAAELEVKLEEIHDKVWEVTYF